MNAMNLSAAGINKSTLFLVLFFFGKSAFLLLHWSISISMIILKAYYSNFTLLICIRVFVSCSLNIETRALKRYVLSKSLFFKHQYLILSVENYSENFVV